MCTCELYENKIVDVSILIFYTSALDDNQKLSSRRMIKEREERMKLSRWKIYLNLRSDVLKKSMNHFHLLSRFEFDCFLQRCKSMKRIDNVIQLGSFFEDKILYLTSTSCNLYSEYSNKSAWMMSISLKSIKLPDKPLFSLFGDLTISIRHMKMLPLIKSTKYIKYFLCTWK